MLGKKSLLNKMLVIFVTVIVLQVVVALSLTLALGVVERQYTQAYNSVAFVVGKKAEQLEILFNDIASNLQNMSEDYSSKINRYLAQNNLTPEELGKSNSNLEPVFLDMAPELTNFLYANPNASGVFIVYSTEALSSASKNVPALYIRRRTQETNHYSTVNYWVLRFGSRQAADKLQIQLDYLWSYYMEIGNNTEFFNKPFFAAKDGFSVKDSYYISHNFRMSDQDIKIITQTVPLLDDSGKPYGVLGIEVSVDSVSKKLGVLDLPDVENSFYAVTDNTNSDFSELLLESNAFAQTFLKQRDIVVTPLHSGKAIYEYKSPGLPEQVMLANYTSLRLYGNNSPFLQERRILYGFLPKSQLLANSDLIRNLLVYIGILFIAISFISAVIASFTVSKPILRLSEQLRSLAPDDSVALLRTGIYEIDQLVIALEQMSKKLMQSASRLSSIINLFEKPIAGFEENKEENRVYISDSIFRVLEMPFSKKYFISIEEWEKFKPEFYSKQLEGYPDTYIYSKNGQVRYMQVNVKTEDGIVYGVISDVTDEVVQKRQLEYERDADGLTKLLNRVAFHKKVSQLLKKSEAKTGAMLFLDLDNLKFINDSYGHEYGDKYIKSMATALLAFKGYGGIISRISGDEFAVFISGYDTEEEVRKIYNDIIAASREQFVLLPDDMFYKLRASMGVAWFPKDASDVDLLIRYADFAMYEVKHSNKGNLKEFSLDSYNKNSFLTNKLEMLDSFIENKLLYFAFQPIVDSKTGLIFGYEALMRSNHMELTSVEQILQLCKTQSKLYLLESLVFNTILKFMQEYGDGLRDRKLFFNTVPSISLRESDLHRLDACNPDIFSKMVLEITESEQASMEETLVKINRMRDLGMQIAMDDFGAGYSNDLRLISTSPDYVKIDICIVKGIESDDNKQRIVQNIVSYSAERGIKVIAEGIESIGELDTLIDLGIDYYQGYLFYKPNPVLVDDNKNIIALVTNRNQKRKA